MGKINMKNHFNNLVFFLTLLISILFTGCMQEPKIKYIRLSGYGSGDNQISYQEIDYNNYYDCSVRVRNESSKNVVCFIGEPSENNLISGARGGGYITGLKRNAYLFGSSSFDFVLSVVTEETYIKYRYDYNKMSNYVLCRIYAYYNSDIEASNNLVYTISHRLGGQNYILLNNATNYNWELRLNGIYGMPLCYAGANTLQSRIELETGDYDFYPVVRRFDRNTGSIVTFYPKNDDGSVLYFPIGVAWDTYPACIIDCIDILLSDVTLEPAAAYLTIQNQSNTGIKLYKGYNSVSTVTDTGITTINSGRSATFEIYMEQSGNWSYEKQIQINNWLTGPEANKIQIPSTTLDAGYRYILVVAGPSYDDLNCNFEVYAEDAADESYKAGDLVKYRVNFDY